MSAPEQDPKEIVGPIEGTLTPTGEASPRAVVAEASPSPRGLLRNAALAALVAGLLAWLGGERLLKALPLPSTPSSRAGGPAFVRHQAEMLRAEGRRSAALYGLLGAAVGLGLGVAGGQSRRSAAGSAAAGVVGLALGGIGGAAAAPWLTPWYLSVRDSASPDLVRALLVHAASWVPIGLAGGLALGMGHSGRSGLAPGAIGGLLGGVLATVAFEVVGALLFPLAQTDDPISKSALTRLLACLIVGGFTALVSAWNLRPPKP